MAVRGRVGVQGEDARRGQEMEEEGARHYFPQSALQAPARARRTAVPLVGDTQERLWRVGEGRPTPGVGRRVSRTLGEEDLGEVGDQG